MKVFKLLIFILFSHFSFAQTVYTENTFSYDSLMRVNYGNAINFNGELDSLFLNIYKPTGDDNCKRPLVVLVHGGAWLAGSNDDQNIRYMSREFAKKGYVAASITYRLGSHKTSNYTMYAGCAALNVSEPCAYQADTAEIIRANYRGMQDAKGAVRFMKNRNLLDSTDVNNTYIVGESAGGFIALSVAFTQNEAQKHPSCGAIADAPNPSSNLNPFGCIPNPLNRSRPDLGSVHGDLNLGEHDASVKGVGNFYGGVFDLEIFNQEMEKPVVYMFHQGSDVVVDWKRNRLLGRINWECYAQTNICQQYYHTPYAYGSESIREYFETLENAPTSQFEIIENRNYMNDCFANGHSILNRSLRVQNMTNLFAEKIAESSNNPLSNCETVHILNYHNKAELKLFPNPAKDFIMLDNKDFSQSFPFLLTDFSGRVLKSGTITNKQIQLDINDLAKGIYFLSFPNQEYKTVRIVKQ